VRVEITTPPELLAAISRRPSPDRSGSLLALEQPERAWRAAVISGGRISVGIAGRSIAPCVGSGGPELFGLGEASCENADDREASGTHQAPSGSPFLAGPLPIYLSFLGTSLC
jgi:hypothetical protein